MKRITVSLDDETHRLAKVKAAEKGTSVSALVRDYLTGLANGEPEAAAAGKSEKTPGETISGVRAWGGRISVGDNLSREDLYERDALRDTRVFDFRRLTDMVITEDNARKIEALFREHLERNFEGTGLKFDPIIVEPAYDQDGRKTFDVMVVFDGDYSLLKPGTLNAISSAMLNEYWAMGIYTTVLDGYTSKEEWDMRDELLAPEPWEFLDPSEFGHLEDC